MASAHRKGAAAAAVLADRPRNGATLSREVKEKRRKLIAAINASQVGGAEKAEAALAKYLDDIYPETSPLAQ